jgi:hypothetical protein
MSDASMPHCGRCNAPEYACGCEEPELVPSLVAQIMTGRFVDTRGRQGCCPRCGGWMPGNER